MNDSLCGGVVYNPREHRGLVLRLSALDVGSITKDGSNKVSQWDDKTINANHGTQGTAAAQPTYSAADVGLSFDDTDDYVDCGTSDSLDITNEITIEAWIKGTYGAAALHSVVAKYGGTDSNYYMVVYQQNLRGLAADSSDSEKIIQTDTVLADDTWYHAAFTAKNNEQKLYLNGVLDKTGAETSSGIDTSAEKLIIGARNNGTSNYFNGLIDEVRIYNRVLSATEIKSSYNDGAAIHL